MSRPCAYQSLVRVAKRYVCLCDGLVGRGVREAGGRHQVSQRWNEIVLFQTHVADHAGDYEEKLHADDHQKIDLGEALTQGALTQGAPRPGQADHRQDR